MLMALLKKKNKSRILYPNVQSVIGSVLNDEDCLIPTAPAYWKEIFEFGNGSSDTKTESSPSRDKT